MFQILPSSLKMPCPLDRWTDKQTSGLQWLLSFCLYVLPSVVVSIFSQPPPAHLDPSSAHQTETAPPNHHETEAARGLHRPSLQVEGAGWSQQVSKQTACGEPACRALPLGGQLLSVKSPPRLEKVLPDESTVLRTPCRKVLLGYWVGRT